MIRKLLNLIAPITVSVHWEDIVVRHKAWSREDALAWSACYDNSAFVFFHVRFKGCQGIRHASI